MELTKNAVLKNAHIKDLQEILARDDIRISAEELLDVIIDFSAKNKQKLLEIIRNRGKNSDILLDEWLSKPVDTDKTDAVTDHDLVA